MVNKNEWEKLRKQVLKRDQNRCRGNVMVGGRCPEEAIDVHHMIPLKKGGVNNKYNCVSLCKRHHAVADNTYEKYGITRTMILWFETNKKLEEKKQ